MSEERQKKKQEQRLQEIKEAWQDVLATNQGRIVINDILILCGHGQSAFNGATNQTIKNIGMQDVGHAIVNLAKDYAFDDFIKLVREANEHG